MREYYDLESPSMFATAEQEKTACCKINVLRQTQYNELMLKTTQIKVPKYIFVLEKHLSKHGLQITTKILTIDNTKKAQNCQNIYVC